MSGLGRSHGEGNGNPLQYSCLGNPMDRGSWQATVHGVAKESVGHDLVAKQHWPLLFHICFRNLSINAHIDLVVTVQYSTCIITFMNGPWWTFRLFCFFFIRHDHAPNIFVCSLTYFLQENPKGRFLPWKYWICTSKNTGSVEFPNRSHQSIYFIHECYLSPLMLLLGIIYAGMFYFFIEIIHILLMSTWKN